MSSMYNVFFNNALQTMFVFYVFFFLSIFLAAGLNIITLNINGLNNVNKQLSLINFMNYRKVDILLIQEHNIREMKVICKELNESYHILMNLSIAHKGGTAIFIDKRLNCNVRNYEMSADSRIISAHLDFYGKVIHIVNIYAPSGGKNSDRDNFFKDDLIFYLRNSLENSIIGGDFNCITSNRDSSSNSTHVCKVLLENLRALYLKDVWFIENRNRPIEYTYIRDHYGSRLDRIYVKSLSNHVNNVKVCHVNFSDHSAIQMKLDLPNVPKIGRFYWKMNVSLLDLPQIKSSFIAEWESWKSLINRYDNINDWWELCAKKKIKAFFINKGKIENQKKYGMLKYLEYSLNRLYNNNNIDNNVDYGRVKSIKSKITEIKSEIMKGVQVRSRVDEQLKGEVVSTFLIQKQAQVKKRQYLAEIKSEQNIVHNLDEGTILNSKDSIEMYIEKYYEKLYTEEPYDESKQDWFLNLINAELNDLDKETLGCETTEEEILNAVKGLNENKSPGIDGIPAEFYCKYWDIIKVELIEIIRNIINGTLLTSSQRNAIITLLPKGGDLKLMQSWRPISLICCDVKIVSKILANRFKPLMNSIISNNQYCINGRTITECNNELRDILFYYGEAKSTGAIINLDWEKAFDRVNWDFLIKIMKKMGFPENIIKWVIVLHTNIQSVCMVNGNLTKPFNIRRGVRQGCPMSMLFFVIFQEPLYKAISISKTIIPPMLPSKQVKNVGYADDTSIMVKNDEGFIGVFNLLEKFQKASNSKLNLRKTKIYGFGEWENRLNWPIKDLKIEMEYFTTLGITFSCKYDIALDRTWNTILNKIKNRIPLIRDRYFTLYQKSVIINSILSSKIWYASHVYPMPLQMSKLINKELFGFLWKYNYDPIKRNVLCNPKVNGGIGIIDVFCKAKSIFNATVIKRFLDSKENKLIKFYMALRVGTLFGVRNLPNKVSHINSPYYEYSVDTIRKCYYLKNFPNVSSKEIYNMLYVVTQPEIEKMYPNYDWKSIWRNVSFKAINIYDRNIIFKYIHEILTNNKRLYDMRLRLSPLCNHCNVEESNVHLFLYCYRVQPCIRWMEKLVFYLCNMDIGNNLLRCLFLDIPKVNRKVQNTLCIIICSYISWVWYNREEQSLSVNSFKAKIVRVQKSHMLIYQNKSNVLFTENYCNMKRGILFSL